jgi:hypothetical protein
MHAAAWKRNGDGGFGERPSDHTLRARADVLQNDASIRLGKVKASACAGAIG